VQGAAGGAFGPDIVDVDGGLRGHAWLRWVGFSMELAGGKAGLSAKILPEKPRHGIDRIP
jgi:hypothetical protein